MDTILDLRPLSRRHHARTEQLAGSAQVSIGNPDRRKRPGPLESVQTVGIQLVVFFDGASIIFAFTACTRRGAIPAA